MNSAPHTEAVRLEGIGKYFITGHEKRVALSDVRCVLRCGEFCLVLGPSGSGKTTLITIAAGLQPACEGEVLLFGRPICSYGSRGLQRLRAREFGFVFQDFRLIESLTVAENVALVLRFAGWRRTEIRRRVASLLDEFDIVSLAERSPDRLSQGEKQRVAIARAVANGARLMFADEPTASLDTSHGQQVICHLADHAHRHGACVVAVTHDPRLVAFADRVFRLEDGLLAEQPASQEPLPDSAPDTIL